MYHGDISSRKRVTGFLKQFINGNVAARILQCCVENPLMYNTLAVCSHNKVESLKVVFCNVDKNRRQNSACVINITLMHKEIFDYFSMHNLH